MKIPKMTFDEYLDWLDQFLNLFFANKPLPERKKMITTNMKL